MPLPSQYERDQMVVTRLTTPGRQLLAGLYKEYSFSQIGYGEIWDMTELLISPQVPPPSQDTYDKMITDKVERLWRELDNDFNGNEEPTGPRFDTYMRIRRHFNTSLRELVPEQMSDRVRTNELLPEFDALREYYQNVVDLQRDMITEVARRSPIVDLAGKPTLLPRDLRTLLHTRNVQVHREQAIRNASPVAIHNEDANNRARGSRTLREHSSKLAGEARKPQRSTSSPNPRYGQPEREN
jgi:hypothetical protein